MRRSWRISSANGSRAISVRLELVVPFLHLAWMRTQLGGAIEGRGVTLQSVDPLSAREKEILRWIHLGKSNFEIGTILGISPLTVKNHVQKIHPRGASNDHNSSCLRASAGHCNFDRAVFGSPLVPWGIGPKDRTAGSLPTRVASEFAKGRARGRRGVWPFAHGL